MARSTFTPCFAFPFPLDESALFFDHEPLQTRLTFKSNNTEEEPRMTKLEFVTYIIQHHEDFPNTGEITLDTAANILDNIADKRNVPTISPEELRDLWNQLVHDPDVMTEEL